MNEDAAHGMRLDLERLGIVIDCMFRQVPTTVTEQKQGFIHFSGRN